MIIRYSASFYLCKSLLLTHITNNFVNESTTHTQSSTHTRSASVEKGNRVGLRDAVSLLREVALLRESSQHHSPHGNMQIPIWYIPPCSAPKPPEDLFCFYWSPFEKDISRHFKFLYLLTKLMKVLFYESISSCSYIFQRYFFYITSSTPGFSRQGWGLIVHHVLKPKSPSGSWQYV